MSIQWINSIVFVLCIRWINSMCLFWIKY